MLLMDGTGKMQRDAGKKIFSFSGLCRVSERVAALHVPSMERDVKDRAHRGQRMMTQVKISGEKRGRDVVMGLFPDVLTSSETTRVKLLYTCSLMQMMSYI